MNVILLKVTELNAILLYVILLRGILVIDVLAERHSVKCHSVVAFTKCYSAYRHLAERHGTNTFEYKLEESLDNI